MPFGTESGLIAAELRSMQTSDNIQTSFKPSFKPGNIVQVISYLLILLWVYAAASKLMDFDRSRGEMLNQALAPWLEKILVWAIPLAELSITALLLFKQTRLQGIILSLVLLLIFTAYIVLVKLNYFDYVPCSCGGIISKLSWEGHFIFNMVFIVLAATAWLLQRDQILFANDQEKPKTWNRVGKNLKINL